MPKPESKLCTRKRRKKNLKPRDKQDYYKQDICTNINKNPLFFLVKVTNVGEYYFLCFKNFTR